MEVAFSWGWGGGDKSKVLIGSSLKAKPSSNQLLDNIFGDIVWRGKDMYIQVQAEFLQARCPFYEENPNQSFDER